VLSNLSKAYGEMMLKAPGLFQADAHPGNVLVRRRGAIGVLDFGATKQLGEKERLGVARQVLALAG